MNFESAANSRAAAAKRLTELLQPLLASDRDVLDAYLSDTNNPVNEMDILNAIKGLVPTLSPDKPIYASFHDGQVHDPLGAGSYAFCNGYIKPLLQVLVDEEELMESSADGMIKGSLMRPFPIFKTPELPSPSDGISRTVTPTEIDAEYDIENGIVVEPPPPGLLPAAEITKATISIDNAKISLPTRPVIIHAGAQPNNSPHGGTLVVFCLTFLLARNLRDEMKKIAVEHSLSHVPPVNVLITMVDTAPFNDEGIVDKDVSYQKSYRFVPDALATYMDDYVDLFDTLSKWSGIHHTRLGQSELFGQAIMPELVQYVVGNRKRLGRQLSPEKKCLALRAACPKEGCGLADKHGRRNEYDDIHGIITFNCPRHGPHYVNTNLKEDVARLEANTPLRNLLRSMSHLTDNLHHHIRVTGSDYAGAYQEMMLYKPITEWTSASTLQHVKGRTPTIVYAPLITDWSGAKLSKSLYIKNGGYDYMKKLGIDALCSFEKMKDIYKENGLKKVWQEVEMWLRIPKKLFRPFSVDYLSQVLDEEMKQEG